MLYVMLIRLRNFCSEILVITQKRDFQSYLFLLLLTQKTFTFICLNHLHALIFLTYSNKQNSPFLSFSHSIKSFFPSHYFYFLFPYINITSFFYFILSIIIPPFLDVFIESFFLAVLFPLKSSLTSLFHMISFLKLSLKSYYHFDFPEPQLNYIIVNLSFLNKLAETSMFKSTKSRRTFEIKLIRLRHLSLEQT